MEEDQSWRLSAACLGSSSTIWFLDRKRNATAPARKICAVCPVVSECAEYAITTNQALGFWGGMSERERRRERARRKLEDN